MKNYLMSMLFFPLAISSSASTKKERQVADAVETFRKGMLAADKASLDYVLADELSYGHSDGHVEGKQDLIEKLSNGTYKFVTMELAEQTISINKKVAIVRHKLDGKTADGGKPNEAHLYVLTVWKKKHGQWKMLARQAVKQIPHT